MRHTNDNDNVIISDEIEFIEDENSSDSPMLGFLTYHGDSDTFVWRIKAKGTNASYGNVTMQLNELKAFIMAAYDLKLKGVRTE